MVSGKPSSQSARGVDIPPTTRLASSGYLCSTCGNTCCKGNQEYGFCSRAIDVCPALWKCVCSCSRLWWTYPQVGMKGKRLLRNYRWMFQACELGLPCKVKIQFRIIRFSRCLRLLNPFVTLSNKSNHMIIKGDVWPKILPWLNSYRCSSRLNNHIEFES
jgi:hypothetical protein